MVHPVPVVPVKGETLDISCPGLPQDRILNAGKYLVPLGSDRWRVGATFAWEFKDPGPSEAGRAELERFLGSLLNRPYQVESHRAAVRPAIRGRRPVAGMHPEHVHAGMINGLGTKGVMLAPWLAEQFTAHLLDGKPLHPETDMARFFGGSVDTRDAV